MCHNIPNWKVLLETMSRSFRDWCFRHLRKMTICHKMFLGNAFPGPVLCSSPGLSPPLLRAQLPVASPLPSPPRYLPAAGPGLRSSDLGEAGQWEPMLAGGEYRRTRGLDRHHQEKSFGTTRKNPLAQFHCHSL